MEFESEHCMESEGVEWRKYVITPLYRAGVGDIFSPPTLATVSPELCVGVADATSDRGYAAVSSLMCFVYSSLRI